MQRQSIKRLSASEIDFILDEESNLTTTKQRKELQRMKKKKSRSPNSSEFRKEPCKLHAKTDRQQQLINTIIEKDQTIVVGPAGTGKTYVTAAMAISHLKEKRVDKIILTRPNVPTGRSIGFFPGTLEEKMEPWVSPVTSIFKEFVSASAYEHMIKSGKIEVVPFEVIRGRSFKNAFIILDESQNTTESEMIAFLTRVGEDSKLVIDGDTRQTDIGESNGLSWAIDRCSEHKYLVENVGIVEFEEEDIVRSGLCRAWVEVSG